MFFRRAPQGQAGQDDEVPLPGSGMEDEVKHEGLAGESGADEAIVVEASSDASESDSTSVAVAESEHEEASRPQKVARVKSSANEVAWYVHRVSKKLHLLRGQAEKPIMERVLAWTL